MNSSRYFALIPAGGVGERMRAGYPKQYMSLAGRAVILHVLQAFSSSVEIAHTFLVVSPQDSYIHKVLAEAPNLAARMTLLPVGGETRQQSVLHGLHAIRNQVDEQDWILVHDAARPGLTVELISRLITALRSDAVGGLLALPVVDTIKQASLEGRAARTIPREGVWAAQTPQMFRYELLSRALTQATGFTDEASAVEALGLQPKLVEGSPRNLKITLPHDKLLAELYLKGIA